MVPENGGEKGLTVDSVKDFPRQSRDDEGDQKGEPFPVQERREEVLGKRVGHSKNQSLCPTTKKRQRGEFQSKENKS